jgi:purine catabolism regulator
MLAELLASAADVPTTRRRLAHAGLPIDEQLVLVIARGRDGDPDDAGLVRRLDANGVAHLLLRQRHELVVLLGDFRGLAELIGSVPELRAGASQPFSAGKPLAGARREAAWSLTRALDADEPLVRYGEDPRDRWLPDDPAGLRGLVDDVLGEPLRYDGEHGTALVNTAHTWLECNRSVAQAARRLHVHPNTLSYRLRRFAALSGRRLTDTADMAEVWLALRAARHIGALPD